MVSLGATEAMLAHISKRDRWCPGFREVRSLAFKGNRNGAAVTGSVEAFVFGVSSVSLAVFFVYCLDFC